MAIDIDVLIDELTAYAPNGVELPKDPDTRQTRKITLERWADEGAKKINERRAITTIKETTLTLVVDQQEYNLPSDCRDIVLVKRQHGSRTLLDVPVGTDLLGIREFGILPSGQQADASIDLINRMSLARQQREDEFEIFGGKLRLLFPVDEEEILIVRYRAISTSLTTVPDDYFDTMLTYMRFRLLDWYVSVHGVNIVANGEVFGQESVFSYRSMRAELEREWISKLNAIGSEAN